MKKTTTVWIMVDKDDKPVGGDVLDALFLVKARATGFVNRWNQDPYEDDGRPYAVRRATLVLDDPA